MRQARPVLEQLAQTTGESAYLGKLEGLSVVCLDVVDTDQPVRVVSHLGRRLPGYATALGKAQLAFRSQEELDTLLGKGDNLAAHTARTLVEPGRLRSELARVAERELAAEDEELEAGVARARGTRAGLRRSGWSARSASGARRSG